MIDAGTRLARTSVAGDEPTATKLISLPLETAETRDAKFRTGVLAFRVFFASRMQAVLGADAATRPAEHAAPALALGAR